MEALKNTSYQYTLPSTRRFLFLKSHSVLLRIGINRFMRMISVAGITVSVLFAACHVAENYVFHDPTIMPGYNFFQSPASMVKVENQLDENLSSSGLNSSIKI